MKALSRNYFSKRTDVMNRKKQICKSEDMNNQQKDYLKNITCKMLDQHSDIEGSLKEQGIPSSLVKKMGKAFDLIFEVNQSCFPKKRKL